MKKNNYETTIVFTDGHSDPRFPNTRFIALGNFIVDRRPTNVAQLGDFGNIDSIAFQNHDKPLLKEGMRLKDDIDSMREAYSLLMAPLIADQDRASIWRKKKYNPYKIWGEGNHEYRTSRYIMSKPELAGFVPETDLVGAAKDGWDVMPYKDYRYIHGVAFTHIPMNPSINKPISGKYISARAAEGQQQTTVFGHDHERSIHSVHRNSPNGGTRIDGLCAGCYFDYSPDYVRGNESQLNWWRGVMVLTHVAPGEIDIETISLARLMEDYL